MASKFIQTYDLKRLEGASKLRHDLKNLVGKGDPIKTIILERDTFNALYFEITKEHAGPYTTFTYYGITIKKEHAYER